jgi:hypothetical protein
MSQRLRLMALTAGLAVIAGLSLRVHRMERAARIGPARQKTASLLAAGHPKGIDYRRDIKPILAARCFGCHGPGAMGASPLRLDRREAAVGVAIVPGHADRSALVARITSHDPDEIMPPPGGNRSRLSQRQIALLRQWIDEGARYDSHWAFSPPVRPPVPSVARKGWARNEIDAFIAAAQESRGLSPSPEADRGTLIRRLHFDVLGLPPSPVVTSEFLADSRPDAVERAVDRLLASPHFGERMAVVWLDLVRYADTDGYSKDAHRDVWMFRDFVIDSFNENKPFDHFTRQQLAGDLLPNATPEDRVGSGYNRLLMTAQEGCADPKEYTHRYAADRVRNVSSAWLGVTLGCAECHDHKFDPFTSRDFYRLAAFFSDIQETPVGAQELTRFSTADQEAELKRLDQRIAAQIADLAAREERLQINRIQWETQLRNGRNQNLPGPVAKVLAVDAEVRDADQRQIITDFLWATTPKLALFERALAELRSRRDALLRVIPASLTSLSGKRRVVRILPRGNWADESGEIMTPGLPACLIHKTKRKCTTRRELAGWLTARDNPLVARVFVNRVWKMAFGKGLVPTMDDFGARGTAPSHPELLDWLAVEFVERGWDVKALFRMILVSSAYRQSSDRRKELLAIDPNNLYLARQNRFPLEAEFVRDNAMTISGILSTKIGGRSVKPFQPAGFWTPRFFEKEYRQDTDGDSLRRGVYTYWCRNYLHPALQVFDAPSRQSCTAERKASSTPLQALVLLNDPGFGETARALAGRIVREGGTTLAERSDFAFRLAQSRPARPAEAAVLGRLFDKHRAEFASDRTAALALVGNNLGELEGEKLAELAAWTSVAKVILNVYETVTRK